MRNFQETKDGWLLAHGRKEKKRIGETADYIVGCRKGKFSVGKNRVTENTEKALRE